MLACPYVETFRQEKLKLKHNFAISLIIFCGSCNMAARNQIRIRCHDIRSILFCHHLMRSEIRSLTYSCVALLLLLLSHLLPIRLLPNYYYTLLRTHTGQHTNTKVFGNINFDPDTEVNRHNNFRTFVESLILLFR